MSKTKITVLCENSAGGMVGVLGEHGFAALIEKDGEKVLLDTGQGLTLANNAQMLRVNLSEVKKIALSHGHYDHTGGLPHVLFPPRLVEITAHPDIFSEHYAEIETPFGKHNFFIGIKYEKSFLEHTLLGTFNFQTGFYELSPGIFFSGEIARTTDFEQGDPRLKLKQGTDFIPDPLLDDASLLIETDKGPLVILGCAHAGVINILKHFSEQTGHKKFYGVIGGTHLEFAVHGPQLEKTIEALESFEPELIAVSHCTGQKAAAICQQHFQERFQFANAGFSIEI